MNTILQNYKKDLLVSYYNFCNSNYIKDIYQNITIPENNQNMDLINVLQTFICDYIKKIVIYKNAIYHASILLKNIKRFEHILKTEFNITDTVIELQIANAYLRSYILIYRNNMKYSLQDKKIQTDLLAFQNIEKSWVENKYNDIIALAFLTENYAIIDYFSQIEGLEFYRFLNNILGLNLKSNIKASKLIKLNDFNSDTITSSCIFA